LTQYGDVDPSKARFKMASNGFDNASRTLPVCNGENKGEAPGAPDCEIHTLSQNESKAATDPAPSATKAEKEPVASAKATTDPKAASTTAAKPKSDQPAPPKNPKNGTIVDSAVTSTVNSTKEDSDKEQKPFYNATNGYNNASRTLPICNGKNQGKCEKHTLSQTDGVD
jgi:hypothetical protein